MGMPGIRAMEVSKAFWTAFGEVTGEMTSEQEEGQPGDTDLPD